MQFIHWQNLFFFFFQPEWKAYLSDTSDTIRIYLKFEIVKVGALLTNSCQNIKYGYPAKYFIILMKKKKKSSSKMWRFSERNIFFQANIFISLFILFYKIWEILRYLFLEVFFEDKPYTDNGTYWRREQWILIKRNSWEKTA